MKLYKQEALIEFGRHMPKYLELSALVVGVIVGIGLCLYIGVGT